MALALDGHATNNETTGLQTSLSVTLSTALAKDIIVVVVDFGWASGGAAASVSSITDGAALTWTKRKYVAAGSQNVMEIWWAYSSGILSADSITVNYNNPSNAVVTVLVFGVNGADTSAPWDTNVSLPASVTTGTNTPSVSGVSTTAGNTMLLGIYGSNSVGVAPTAAGSTFTIIDDSFQAFSGQGSGAAAEYKVVSASQSSVSVAFAATSGSAGGTMLADAIKAPLYPAPRRIRNFIDRRQ
jgi:hypothetical protein